MSYSVKLSDESRREISGWKLSSHLIREILDGLDRLGDNPSSHLLRVGPPHDVLQYDLIVREQGELPRDHLFVFTVLYATDEERLFIVACDHEYEDRPELE